jgi:hypothetical protein
VLDVSSGENVSLDRRRLLENATLVTSLGEAFIEGRQGRRGRRGKAFSRARDVAGRCAPDASGQRGFGGDALAA